VTWILTFTISPYSIVRLRRFAAGDRVIADSGVPLTRTVRAPAAPSANATRY